MESTEEIRSLLLVLEFSAPIEGVLSSELPSEWYLDVAGKSSLAPLFNDEASKDFLIYVSLADQELPLKFKLSSRFANDLGLDDSSCHLNLKKLRISTTQFHCFIQYLYGVLSEADFC